MKWLAIAILGTVVATATLSIEAASALLIGTKDQIVGYFDWLFVGVASGTLALAFLLGIHPRANLRLGPDDAKPEFSRFSWFAMLFSAGLASGLLYWAAAEPIIHFQDNPWLAAADAGPDSAIARKLALRITIFHWGFHGWGMYVVGGLAIAISSYRHGRPLTIRSALYPILGPRWIDRWPGHAVDLIALLGTVFGVATSIGLTAAALNATLSSLIGWEVTLGHQVAIIFGVSTVGVISAVSGVARGIRRLSEINIGMSSLFVLAIFVLGSTGEILELVVASATDYLIHFLPLGLWLGDTASERNWQADWTVFYWAWWLAWMPFVSLFIARISKGRRIREFVFGVIAAPTLAIIVWMAVLGGTALLQESSEPGSVRTAVNQDSSLGIVTIVENLGAPDITVPLLGLVALLLFTWLVTSLDSAALVISHLVGRPDSTTHKAFWGLALASVTAALIWVGGLDALQAASILIGLPLAFVTILIGAGLLKDLRSGDL